MIVLKTSIQDVFPTLLRLAPSLAWTTFRHISNWHARACYITGVISVCSLVGDPLLFSLSLALVFGLAGFNLSSFISLRNAKTSCKFIVFSPPIFEERDRRCKGAGENHP